MQQEILEQNPTARIHVYAVWFSMIRGDSRDGFKPELLNDPRVTHFWDEQKTVGRWFQENYDVEGCDDEILWDAFFVFGPEAAWVERAEPVECSGFTVWSNREMLAARVASMVAPTR